jgi:hypothetical protein
VHLEEAALTRAHLAGANLWHAHLEGAGLDRADLEGANLAVAHLERANLFGAHLEGADLRRAVFDAATTLDGAQFGATGTPTASVAGLRWAGADLSVVAWAPVLQLGDEHIAHQRTDAARKPKAPAARGSEYGDAARAYRAFSLALRAQGLSADATRFHFRAELMERKALFHRRAPVRWFLSLLLGAFAGYGDKLWRLLFTYAAVVSVFAGAMLGVLTLYGHQPLSFEVVQDAVAFSAISFHGLGLQPAGLVPTGAPYVALNDALAHVAAVEAALGLAIEALFVAAFTRRVTGG